MRLSAFIGIGASADVYRIVRLSLVLNSEHYFSYVLVELKGPSGSAGEARIQNAIACYIALRIHSHLARLARDADPQSYLPPTEVMQRVYGLQTVGGGGIWKLEVMTACGGGGSKGKNLQGQRQTDAAGGGGEIVEFLAVDRAVDRRRLEGAGDELDQSEEEDEPDWTSFVSVLSGCSQHLI